MIKIKAVAQILGLIFAMNFIWEIGQMFLYKDLSSGAGDFISIHLRASLGDVFLFLLIYAIGVLLFRNFLWIFRKGKRPFVFTAFAGLLIAVMVEKIALNIGRWEYKSIMPVILLLDVGLIPVLQLVFIPLSTLLIIRMIYQK